MRALILAAGLGTRMLPLSRLLPKPALPVRGLPVIAYLLALLRHHGVSEVVVNLHHLGEQLQTAVERYRPPGLAVHFSREERLLGTGGAIRRVAEFLRESEPALVLGGDMILDADLTTLMAEHRARGRFATLLLRRDRRAAVFGTIGVDGEGCVRRIGGRFDLGGERDAGIFVSTRLLSRRAFDTLPDLDTFEDLSDWIAPRLARGDRDIHGALLDSEECAWEPVGTPAEYLRINLALPRLSYLEPDALASACGVRLEGDLVLGAGARLGLGAHLERAVVWEGERIPAGLRARDGVFAGGRFHSCTEADTARRKEPR